MFCHTCSACLPARRLRRTSYPQSVERQCCSSSSLPAKFRAHFMPLSVSRVCRVECDARMGNVWDSYIKRVKDHEYMHTCHNVNIICHARCAGIWWHLAPVTPIRVSASRRQSALIELSSGKSNSWRMLNRILKQQHLLQMAFVDRVAPRKRCKL